MFSGLVNEDDKVKARIALCEFLGLDPANTTSVEVRTYGGDYPIVTAGIGPGTIQQLDDGQTSHVSITVVYEWRPGLKPRLNGIPSTYKE